MNKSSQRIGAVAFVLLLVASMGLVSFAAVPVAADHTDTSGDGHFTEGSSETVSVNQSVSLNIEDKSQTVGEARIILENPHKDDSIEVNDSANSNVSVKSDATNTTDEIGDKRMVIELEAADGGETAVSDFEEVFQTAEFTNTASDTSLEERRIRFSLGSRLPMDETGHYYEHVEESKSWNDAESAGHTYPGDGTLSREGYLATIRSADEDEWVNSLMGDQHVWLGATNPDDKDDWEWEGGSPEDGVTFWTGGDNGDLQYGYENWQTEDVGPGGAQPDADEVGKGLYKSDSSGLWYDLDKSD